MTYVFRLHSYTQENFTLASICIIIVNCHFILCPLFRMHTTQIVFKIRTVSLCALKFVNMDAISVLNHCNRFPLVNCVFLPLSDVFQCRSERTTNIRSFQWALKRVVFSLFPPVYDP